MINPVDLGMHSKDSYGDDKSEVEYRCCARTAYYSLFHHFKKVADSIPGDYDKSLGSHERVIRKLLDSSDEQHRKYGVALGNYKEIRVKADYKINVSFSKTEAYKILRFAEKTFNI